MRLGAELRRLKPTPSRPHAAARRSGGVHRAVLREAPAATRCPAPAASRDDGATGRRSHPQPQRSRRGALRVLRRKKLVGGVLVPNASAEGLPAAVEGVDGVHFAGHADATLRGARTLAWMKEGKVEVVDAVTLASVMRNVPLVVLNGCESEEPLGRALANVGVTVVCWSTKTADEPARFFAEGFWGKWAASGSVAAFLELQGLNPDGTQKLLTCAQEGTSEIGDFLMLETSGKGQTLYWTYDVL